MSECECCNICLTSRGSAVRIRQRPQIENQAFTKIVNAFFLCFILSQKYMIIVTGAIFSINIFFGRSFFNLKQKIARLKTKLLDRSPASTKQEHRNV